MTLDDSVQGVLKWAWRKGVPRDYAIAIVAEYQSRCNEWRAQNPPDFVTVPRPHDYGQRLVHYNTLTWQYAAKQTRKMIEEMKR